MNTNDSAKTIVCYGDSNTWGRAPKAGRYPRSVRWTGFLQKLLGDNYEVISEGVSGRTFVVVDPENPWRSGITHLKSILRSNLPIDVMIIMLGTNDTKDKFNLELEDIGKHLQQTIDLIRKEDIKNILIVCPSDIVIPESGIADPRYIGGSDKMKKLPKLYKEVADKNNCHFIDAGQYIASSTIDGLHLEPEAHKKLAEVLRDEILKMAI
ncbi:MAG: GDSL-type esterase/lipase family protein [Patescibacteria group bacterium]|nr:GDSL-type esterase/lipase family protein [Patescibacteria group bacterium]